MGLKKSILIVTSGQPSANPRVIKEAAALSHSGYKVSVIYIPISPWADAFDKNIFRDNPQIKWIRAGYHQVDNNVLYYLARLRLKAYRLLYTFFPFLLNDYVRALVLFSQELSKAAIKIKADLYIGHNIGALPAVLKAAKKNNGLCAFDAEDYHLGEFTESDTAKELVRKIEDYYFNIMSYITAASPLIAKTYQERFTRINCIVINNVFSIGNLQKPLRQNDPAILKLFWFSQTVGSNRGLETVVDAVNLLSEYNISLHILGNCKTEYKQQLKSRWKNKETIEFFNPVEPDKIFSIANHYDVGLATEIPYCINRDLCLTNKIFTYMMAANCILASDTSAQKKLLTDNAGAGLLYRSENSIDLSEKLKFLYLNKAALQTYKEQSYKLAESSFNWEIESEKLTLLVKGCTG